MKSVRKDKQFDNTKNYGTLIEVIWFMTFRLEFHLSMEIFIEFLILKKHEENDRYT